MKTEEATDVGKLVASIAQRYIGARSVHHSSFHTDRYYEDRGVIKQLHLPHSAETGLDCSALVNLVVHDALNTMGIRAEIPRHVKEFFRSPIATTIRPGDICTGALLFVHASSKRTPPSHIGIYLGSNEVVHSPGTMQGYIEKINLDEFIRGSIPIDGYGLFAAKILTVS